MQTLTETWIVSRSAPFCGEASNYKWIAYVDGWRGCTARGFDTKAKAKAFATAQSAPKGE